MLTAIGRAAARRVLLPSRTASSKLTQLPRGSVVFRLPNASTVFAAARPLSVSAWLREPTKTASTGKTKKTTATKKKTTATKKKKTTATKKKAKKVVAPKKKAKKVLSPEEQDKADLRLLKKMALLKGPALLPDSAWSVFVSNNIATGQGKLTDQIKDVSAKFSGLSVSEKEALESTAQSNKNANKTTREKWVTDYPVEAIYMANIARRRIARKLDKSRLYLIHDERLPKRARTPYILFIMSRYSHVHSQSADARPQDTFRAMSEEWKALSESEKQPFKEASTLEVQQTQAQLKELKEKAKAYWKAQGISSTQVF